MQAYTFSFIGVGNMGGALARAAVKKLPPEQVFRFVTNAHGGAYYPVSGFH